MQALYRFIDVTGVFLMGVVGGTIARKQEYDIIGFFFLALFSALGGGMVRDALIQRGTVAAVASPEYLILAFTGAIIAGSWAVTGATKALSFGLPLLSALLMGVLTATGGGMIRDVVTGHRPKVFGGNQLSVVPAIAAALVCAIFYHLDLQVLGMILGLIVGAGLAIVAYWLGWQLGTDPEFAPATMTARQIKHLATAAARRGRRMRGKGVDKRDPHPASADDLEDKERIEEVVEVLMEEKNYSFEEILRAMHEDETEEGRHHEREFIDAWLSWRETR